MRITLALVVGLLTSTGLAQTSEDLSWIVEVLDAPDWAVREAFTERLQNDPEISLRQIESLVQDESISAEARLRLAQVAKVRFFQSSRAAVGMGPMDSSMRFGVTVGRLQDGFDAQRVLRRGDKLVRAQGHAVRDWDRFRALILSNDPGDIFEVVVVRDGETIPLSFALGRYSNLDNRDPSLDPQLLEEAWQIRMADALNAHFGQSADTGFASEPMWRQEKLIAQAQWPNEQERSRSSRATMRRSTPTAMAAGHQAVFDWGQLERVRPGARAIDRGMSDEQTVQIYKRHLEEQEARIEALRRRLDDPSLDDRMRRSTGARIEQMSAAVSRLKRWIAEVEGAEPGG